MTVKHIPFEVETSRIIELLAKQIYQSPLALLRENVQNAFDAVRERRSTTPLFEPSISIDIERERIVIIDNGIGMSSEELRKHFWTAGSSSKNTPQARAAGVVGTFGIGAMANFGVAKTLIVETESARTGERTISRVKKESLSLRDDCVELIEMAPTGHPGTKIIAELEEPGSIDLAHAQRYVQEFVRLVDIPIRVNGQLVSQVDIRQLIPEIPIAHQFKQDSQLLNSQIRADVELSISNNAALRITLTNIFWDEQKIDGRMVLLSGNGTLQTARSGFGLAIVPIASIYSFGGVADFLFLQPTAGREAITSEGVQILQVMINAIDYFVSECLSHTDQCNFSTAFMHWAQGQGRYDLMGRLTIEVADGNDISLANAYEKSRLGPVNVYGGSDPTIIRTFSTETSTLLIYSRTNPRRQCQESYISRVPSIENIPDSPTITKIESGSDLTGSKWGVAFRLTSILSDDYFVEATVAFADISHGVVVLLMNDKPESGTNVILNNDTSSVITLMQVFDTHIDSFKSLAKDFVRNIIFPRISHLVPSSTRQGAEAFIEAMRRKRETFEYDSEELDELPTIWADYHEGKISLQSAIDLSKYSVRTNVQYVEAVSSVREVVPDLLENENILHLQGSIERGSQSQWAAEPSIMRIENSSSAKLITIDNSEPDLRGYRCFIALAPRAYDDFGDFFTQPHSTSVVWGGQKTLFIFIHHSGEFGVYYDMQTSEFVGQYAGGGSQQTCTIILRDKIYIPIPLQIQNSFVPSAGERKRFEIKADLIRIGQSKSN